MFAQLRFASVPLYLHEWLWRVSRDYTRQPDNYIALVTETLNRFSDVLFVTLNYDTLLDNVLAAYSPLSTLEDYVAFPREWALYKLHGSVNWGQPVAFTPDNYLYDDYLNGYLSELGRRRRPLELNSISPIVRLPDSESLSSYRVSEGGLTYPALSAPLGPDDEIRCPAPHVESLRQRLTQQDGLMLIVIGYSGIDNEVLKLFWDSHNTLTALIVVDVAEDAAERTKQAILHAFRPQDDPYGRVHIEDGFNGYVQSGRLVLDLEWFAGDIAGFPPVRRSDA